MRENLKRSLLLALTTITLLLASGCSGSTQPTMSAEEYKAYRESFISRYDVLSLMQYSYQKTNVYGGVQDVDVCYAFTYVDGSGELHEVEGFQHLEYGLTKIQIGDADQYVIDKYGETHRYLYLTEDTLKNMRHKE